MNPLRNVCLVLCLLASAFATGPLAQQMHGNSLSNSLRPSEWLTTSRLENLPAVNELTLKRLENMPVDDAADMLNSIYHLSKIDHSIAPRFVPNPAEIPVYIQTQNDQQMNTNLAQLIPTAKQQQNFGDEELTVFITGLPSQDSPAVAKATRKLMQAYRERYNQYYQNNNNKNLQQNQQNDDDSSEENLRQRNQQEDQKNRPAGTLLVIDLGNALRNFENIATLNTVKTGAMIGNILTRMAAETHVLHENMHIVAQGIAAHVAGAAGRQYTRMTGHQLRRITALDPSKIYAKNPAVIVGLARGDAEFVDAIHTSAYGMGTPLRVGDVDFYPNGPTVAPPGSDSIVEAAMRATRYFAETVRPGNERNFPAVAANSLQQYKSNNGHGKRAYMGLAAEYDLKGDYVLQVNSKAPFGRRAPVQKQNTYHGVHQNWNTENQDYE